MLTNYITIAGLGLLMFYYIVYTENTYDFAHRSAIIPVCIALMLFAGLKIVKSLFVIY